VTVGLSLGSADVDAVEGVDVADVRPVVEARGPRWLLVAVLVVVNVPIVVATVRALARGWLPLGDNGILLVRARDVGSAHHPLLGSWTSASLVVGDNLNNPGPLYFDVLAPWVRLLGPWVGLAVGVMLVNMAASSLAVVAARRVAGAVGLVGVAVAVVGLQFAMGSELLFDVWQPNALVLPFLAFLVVAAAVAAGDVVMVPWLVGVGSLVVQTHMSHAVIVAVMGGVAVATCVWQARRQVEPVAWRRPLVWSAVVAVLAWCQPVIEQFTGRGDGNLTRIAHAATSGDATSMGWSRAVRIVAELLVGSPWFTRESYGEVFTPAPAGPDPVGVALGVVPASAVVLGVVGGLGALAMWMGRAGRRGLATLAGMAAAAVAATVVALALVPLAQYGVSAHQMRWAWVAVAFAYAAVVSVAMAAAWSWLTARWDRGPSRATRSRRWLVPACVLTPLAIVALVNLRTHRSTAEGPTVVADALTAGRELVADLGVLDDRGTVFFDPSTLAFAEPYSGLVFAALQDEGVPFVFDDEGFIRQFGEGRRDDGEAALRLWQVQGEQALVVPAGAERVGVALGPSGPVALFVEPVG
jgi:hypothetical protein